MDPVIARKTWRTAEPIHGMIYFAPEAKDVFEGIGLKGGRMGYFASRSAAFGAASAETVIATFYNFSPALVRAALPAAWSLASPEAVLQARLDLADRALRRALGAAVDSPGVAEAAGIARDAALAASEHLAGRPLFAAHSSLPWPAEPHLALWHAQTLLREFRGDGHIAALVSAGLGPVEALVTHAASGEADARTLRLTRAWPDADWDAAVARLLARGLLSRAEPLTLSAAGEQLRQQLEDRTDVLALPAYEAVGEAACARLRELARPLSVAIVEGGGLRPDPAGFTD